MSRDEKRDLVYRVVDEVFTQGNADLVGVTFRSDYVGRFPWFPAPVEGADGMKLFVRGLRTAFPDLRIEVDEVVAGQGSVAFRWRAEGTHRGDFFGVGATGSRFAISGINVAHVRDGKIAEEWSSWDMLGLLRQLGLAPDVPEPTPTRATAREDGTFELFGGVPPGG